MTEPEPSDLDLQQRRAAKNQSPFREVNERIEDLSGPASFAIFICECTDETCDESLSLTIEEYEHIRSDSNRFPVLPGHQVPADRLTWRILIEQAKGVLIERLELPADEGVRTAAQRRTPLGDEGADDRRGAPEDAVHARAHRAGDPALEEAGVALAVAALPVLLRPRRNR